MTSSHFPIPETYSMCPEDVFQVGPAALSTRTRSPSRPAAARIYLIHNRHVPRPTDMRAHLPPSGAPKLTQGRRGSRAVPSNVARTRATRRVLAHATDAWDPHGVSARPSPPPRVTATGPGSPPLSLMSCATAGGPARPSPCPCRGGSPGRKNAERGRREGEKTRGAARRGAER